MDYFVGTSGYSYKEWKGSFYPQDLPARMMLHYYSRNLPAVEVNNTFYRMPSAKMVESWAEQVPEGFRFVLKASRKITHIRPLKDKGEEVDYLFSAATAMGDKLGAILFQFPPYLHKDIELLKSFTDLLPPEVKTVFEFRHSSWCDSELHEALQAKGCALCCSDEGTEEFCQLIDTAGWGYLRLRKESYTKEELLDWAGRIASRNWKEVYVFFKHEDAAAGPKLARDFLDLIGQNREGGRK